MRNYQDVILWIKLFTVALIAVLAGAAALSPKYFAAAKELRGAKAAFDLKQYETAIRQYREVLRAVPSSRVARIGVAEALLSDSDQANDAEALRILSGVELTRGDCLAISKRIPARFHQFFEFDGHP